MKAKFRDQIMADMCLFERVAALVLEEAEEAAVGRQDHRCVAVANGFAIGFHRAVEGEELGVLTKAVSLDLNRLTIALTAGLLGFTLRLGDDHGTGLLGVGADLLRFFLTRGAELLGLAFTL